MRVLDPFDIDIVESQDTELGAELIHLAECGFCEHGEQVEMYARGGADRGSTR